MNGSKGKNNIKLNKQLQLSDLIKSFRKWKRGIKNSIRASKANKLMRNPRKNLRKKMMKKLNLRQRFHFKM